MKKDYGKLKIAEQRIAEIEAKPGGWFMYANPDATILIDREFLDKMAVTLGDFLTAAQDLAQRYRKVLRDQGKPSVNPAMAEVFMNGNGLEMLPAYFATVNDKVYVSGIELMPF